VTDRPVFDQRAHLKAIARKGGAAFAAKAAQARARRGEVQPYAGTFLEFMTACGLEGPTWARWRVLAKAIDGIPLEAEELAAFQEHTGRTVAPTAPVTEVWVPAGRRAGKSRFASVRAAYQAVRADWSKLLAPGEQALVMCLAASRDQVQVVLRYTKALFEREALAPFVAHRHAEELALRTGATIRVAAASFKTTRGWTLAGVVCDEISFWSDEGANPDAEVLTALRPALATAPGSLLLAISTPYAQRGELYRAFAEHYGRDGDPVLVWRADSATMNPTLPATVIARAYADDPVAAAAEWGATFRSDVEAFLSPQVVAAACVADRFELAPREGVEYLAFCDPSGGSRDSMTLAIAHADGERAVLDCIREVKPPLSPDVAVGDFAATLKAYHVSQLEGDRYGGEWVPERFLSRGITYLPSERSRSELYMELLPLMNAGRVELLDDQRLRAQLLGLERRTSRGGKDSIDHAPGGHDDVANAVAGAVVLAQGGPRQITDVVLPALFRSGGDTRLTDEARDGDMPTVGWGHQP